MQAQHASAELSGKKGKKEEIRIEIHDLRTQLLIELPEHHALQRAKGPFSFQHEIMCSRSHA